MKEENKRIVIDQLQLALQELALDDMEKDLMHDYISEVLRIVNEIDPIGTQMKTKSNSELLGLIKEDLVGVLITLGENSLSDECKIKEADKIIIETIGSID